MDVCRQDPYCAYPWQATLPTIMRHLKDELELAKNTSMLYHQPVHKKLTTEALFTIFVIMVFVILTLIRTAISVYESYKLIGKEAHSSTIKRKGKPGNAATNAEEEKKLFKTSSNTVLLTNLRRFLDCFCIKSNTRRILSTVSTQEQFCSLHGIKSILAIWIIMGHFGVIYSSIVRQPESYLLLLNLKAMQTMKNSIFAIDVFLVLSGFLNGYSFSQLYEKRKGKIPWLSFYLHRLARIIPIYYIVLGFYSTLFPFLGSGPVWPTYETNPVCKENWMWNVLFLNNFISHKKLCLASTWYLACEMQLYIISPIFLILLMRKPKVGYILIFLGISGSCFINFLFTKQYNLVDGPSRYAEYYPTNLKYLEIRFWDYYDILYSKPYARLGTYLIGIALGYYLYRRKYSTIKKNNVVKLSLGWIMTALFTWISIFSLDGREESLLETAVYNGLKHVLTSSSVAWIVFVCATGQGGFVNRFLSSKIFIVISRLSYTIYLINLIIIEGFFMSMDDLLDYSFLKLANYLPLLFLHFPAAFVVSLIFEAPTLKVTALFFKETKAYKQE